MGNSRIEIEVWGNHGCDRNIKDGGKVIGCGRMGCVDCETRRFVKQLQSSNSVTSARLIHWPKPGTAEPLPHTVIDDLLSGARSGSF